MVSVVTPEEVRAIQRRWWAQVVGVQWVALPFQWAPGGVADEIKSPCKALVWFYHVSSKLESSLSVHLHGML